MTTPLNGQLEVGLRVAMLLAASYPDSLDVGRLVLLDHALLHSGDLGGPTSVHPDLPLRAGELGMKRAAIRGGAEFACRLGLAYMQPEKTGIEFRASERAEGFLALLEAQYAKELLSRASWIQVRFKNVDDTSIRVEMQSVFGHRSEEFGLAAGVGE